MSTTHPRYASRPDTHNAACGIETGEHPPMPVSHRSPDTHNAACGIETTPNPLRCTRDSAVPTHIMPRAALKLLTEDARCDIADVPTHIMPRAVLTAKRLCVSFRSHRAVFVCKKRTAILTMRRTDVSIEIQKGHCRTRLPNNRMKFPPTVWKLKADFSYLSSNDDHQ